MTPQEEREAIIRTYLDAFKQANPHRTVPVIRRGNGWVYLDNSPYRYNALETMRDRLLDRVYEERRKKGS